jgi:hypothetical protein
LSAESSAQPPRADDAAIASCAVCGCTEDNACVLVARGEVARCCSWVARDLCSACELGASRRTPGTWIHPAERLAIERRYVYGVLQELVTGRGGR